MNSLRTLCKVNNLQYYMQICDGHKVSDIARKVGISYPYASKLNSIWISQNLIQKQSIRNGFKFFYTDKGIKYRDALVSVYFLTLNSFTSCDRFVQLKLEVEDAID